MIWRVIPLLMLAACGHVPVVQWPAGPQPEAPTLLPAADLALGPPARAEAQGAALAAKAAALKLRAAAIPVQ